MSAKREASAVQGQALDLASLVQQMKAQASLPSAVEDKAASGSGSESSSTHNSSGQDSSAEDSSEDENFKAQNFFGRSSAAKPKAVAKEVSSSSVTAGPKVKAKAKAKTSASDGRQELTGLRAQGQINVKVCQGCKDSDDREVQQGSFVSSSKGRFRPWARSWQPGQEVGFEAEQQRQRRRAGPAPTPQRLSQPRHGDRQTLGALESEDLQDLQQVTSTRPQATSLTPSPCNAAIVTAWLPNPGEAVVYIQCRLELLQGHGESLGFRRVSNQVTWPSGLIW